MLYQVALFQEYFGQQCVNYWTYNGTGTPASVLGSFALMSALGFIPDGTPPAFPADTVFAAIRSAQSNQVRYTSALVSALSDYDLADFYTRPFIADTRGQNTDQALSPTIAFGFRTNRVTRAIRRATKRLVGVPEMATAAGGVIAESYVAPLQLIATRMSEVLVYDDEGNTLSFTPCVVSQREIPNPDKPGQFKRVYWPTLAEQLQHTAQGILWEAYNTTRTQTSRQYGRGI